MASAGAGASGGDAVATGASGASDSTYGDSGDESAGTTTVFGVIVIPLSESQEALLLSLLPVLILVCVIACGVVAV